MKVRVSRNAGCRDMELPVEGAKLAWLVERIGGGSRNLWCMLEKAWGLNVQTDVEAKNFALQSVK